MKRVFRKTPSPCPPLQNTLADPKRSNIIEHLFFLYNTLHWRIFQVLFCTSKPKNLSKLDFMPISACKKILYSNIFRRYRITTKNGAHKHKGTVSSNVYMPRLCGGSLCGPWCSSSIYTLTCKFSHSGFICHFVIKIP